MIPKRTRTKPQLFVLTPDEKKTIVFVLCALLLGVATKHYRDTHSPPPSPSSVKEQRAANKAARLHRLSRSSTPK